MCHIKKRVFVCSDKKKHIYTTAVLSHFLRFIGTPKEVLRLHKTAFDKRQVRVSNILRCVFSASVV